MGPKAHDAWEVVCRDGEVRHPPYHNAADARSDAAFLNVRWRCKCGRADGHTARKASPHAEAV